MDKKVILRFRELLKKWNYVRKLYVELRIVIGQMGGCSLFGK